MRLTQLQENDKPVVVYSTCPSLAVAEEIGSELVERGLAACVNILPGMVSIYVWQGERQRDEEVVVIVKTTEKRANDVIAAICELHPYDVPAALVLPASGGAEDFVDWIRAQVRKV
jgi:periplasmic divalent cation tolerance protein